MKEPRPNHVCPPHRKLRREICQLAVADCTEPDIDTVLAHFAYAALMLGLKSVRAHQEGPRSTEPAIRLYISRLNDLMGHPTAENLSWDYQICQRIANE